MSSFEIETGVVLSPLRDCIPDFFQDMYQQADDTELAKRYCFYVIGEITGPKKLETTRKHFLANWRFIRLAFDTCPEHADEIIVAYAERAQAFD
jgi:hypothetical protein